MQTLDIDFGEWLPNAPEYKNPGIIRAMNIIPMTGGYGPMASPVGIGLTTLPGPCRGAATFYTAADLPLQVGGSSTALWTLRGSTLANTTGYTAIGDGASWDFAQFNQFIIATTSANKPQYLSNLGSDDSWSDLPGSPPNAKVCARIGEFLMLGDIANVPNRIQWSAFNNPSSWAASRLTQANFADLPLDYGRVQRIVGGRFSLVFQERGVGRLEYIGPPVVWRYAEIEKARGALAPFAVVTVGFLTYFLGQDGFWATDGSSFLPIGTQRVNQWFLNQADNDRIQETHATIDWPSESIVWAFISRGGSGFDRFIRYSWGQNRWAEGELAVDRFVDTSGGGLTLEQIGAIYPDLEAVPFSLDDPRWSARFRVLAAYRNNDFAVFSGPSLAARIETGEFQPVPGRRVFASRARMLGEGAQLWKVAPATYQNDRQSNFGPFRGAGVAGWAPMRADGQSMRIACIADAGTDWRTVQGVQPTFRISGAR